MQGYWQEVAGTAEYQKTLADYAFYRRQVLGRLADEGGMGPLEDECVMPKAPLVNKWLIGCDPEFVIIGPTGELVNTQDIIPQRGPIGWDHSGYAVEFRPEPARGTFQVLKRLQALVQSKDMEKLRKYSWRSGAYVKAKPRGVITLGGHVHLDMPPPNHGNGDEDEHHAVIEACDRWTMLMEGLDILPRAESNARRTDARAVREGYGQWSDWRPAGERGERMEYRTPASWLFDPKVAFLTMTGIKLAAVSPATMLEKVPRTGHGWKHVEALLDCYKGKDSNARRALEKLVEGRSTPAHLHVDPAVNFADRWGTLGL